MIVMKFGGSSVADAERIRNVVKIIELNRARHPVVVVSGMDGVTDDIIDAAELAIEKRDAKALKRIKEKHLSAISELGINSKLLDEDLKQLGSIIKKISDSGELTPRVLDNAVSFGERMSSKIIAAYMRKKGIKATAHNAYDIGLITDSNFGEADYLPGTPQEIKKALAKRDSSIPIITGYIAKDRKGNITTLGRGGSDYTASIIGAAIGVEEIQIWTDVNGIMTADPRIVKNAVNISEVSYSEASELAFIGAKGLHPKTILPAISNGITIRILNTFNPKQNGTVVLKDIKTRERIASIACKKMVKMMYVQNSKRLPSHRFLKNVFEVLDSNGISVDTIATSGANVHITLHGPQNIDKAAEELSKIAEIDMQNGARISLVGKNIAFMPDLSRKLFSSLGNIKVEMTSLSTSDINQSFVIKEEDAEDAVIRLHKEFFGR